MDRNGGPHTALTIALHGGIYLSIIMDRYGGPQTSLTIALHGDLYLAIIINRYRGPQTDLTVALPLGLYVAIIIVPLWRAPNCPYYTLPWRPLHNHYNGRL
jgi:hypothetical protein